MAKRDLLPDFYQSFWQLGENVKAKLSFDKLDCLFKKLLCFESFLSKSFSIEKCVQFKGKP